MDLDDFLLARFAEDARVALGVMAAEDDASAGAAAPYGYGDVGPSSEIEREHMTRWDPARVLAECEAKRRIVELHSLEWRERAERVIGEADDPFCAECFAEPWPCQTLRLLALPYANHSDYREEWKP